MLLEGIFPALTTPFYPDGRLYLRKLEQNVDRYSRTPVAGVVVLGSTGEAIFLREEEQVQVLETVAKSAAPEKVLLAGVGQESVLATLALAEKAARFNYDAVLVRTPHYYRTQMRPTEMLHYYRAVADASSLPVLLYSVPACTAYELPVELAAELAHHPNIIGIKDSSNNPARIAEIVRATRDVKHLATVTTTFAAVTERMVQVASREAVSSLVQLEVMSGADVGATPMTAQVAPAIKTRTREVGFQVLAGSAASLHESLQAGAVGAVLALASAAPQACYEVFAAHREQNPALAAEKQLRLLPAAKRIAAEMGVPGVKYAAELNGYFGGFPRAPLLPLTARERDEVAELMADLQA